MGFGGTDQNVSSAKGGLNVSSRHLGRDVKWDRGVWCLGEEVQLETWVGNMGVLAGRKAVALDRVRKASACLGPSPSPVLFHTGKRKNLPREPGEQAGGKGAGCMVRMKASLPDDRPRARESAARPRVGFRGAVQGVKEQKVGGRRTGEKQR